MLGDFLLDYQRVLPIYVSKKKHTMIWRAHAVRESKSGRMHGVSVPWISIASHCSLVLVFGLASDWVAIGVALCID